MVRDGRMGGLQPLLEGAVRGIFSNDIRFSAVIVVNDQLVKRCDKRERFVRVARGRNALDEISKIVGKSEYRGLVSADNSIEFAQCGVSIFGGYLVRRYAGEQEMGVEMPDSAAI